jgi:hypothetical protein
MRRYNGSGWDIIMKFRNLLIIIFLSFLVVEQSGFANDLVVHYSYDSVGNLVEITAGPDANGDGVPDDSSFWTNHPPVASNGTLSTTVDTAATGTLAATDADDDPLTFSIVTNGTLGAATVTDTATGAFTYTPNAGVTGTDTFTFKANDGLVNSNTATVTIQIESSPSSLWAAYNFQPAGSELPSGYSMDSGGVFDSGLGYGWIQGPGSLGTRDRNSSASPDQTYDTLIHVDPSSVWEMAVENGNYDVTVCVGDPLYPDSHHRVQIEGVSAIDGYLDAGTMWIENMVRVVVEDGTLTLTFSGSDPYAKLDWLKIYSVDATNVAPTATDGTLTTTADAAAIGTLTATDAGGDPLTFSIVTNGTLGTASITNPATGAYTYTPNSGASGIDSFTFKANDARRGRRKEEGRGSDRGN